MVPGSAVGDVRDRDWVNAVLPRERAMLPMPRLTEHATDHSYLGPEPNHQGLHRGKG